MTTRGLRNVGEKVADWKQAYEEIAENLSPQELRDRWNELMRTPLPDDEDNVITFTARMNTAMALGRMLAANDRAAGTIAALITQTGIKPAAIDYGDDT